MHVSKLKNNAKFFRPLRRILSTLTSTPTRCPPTSLSLRNSTCFGSKLWMIYSGTYSFEFRLYFGKKYVIIYYHCLSDSLYPYTFLKSIYKKLPLFYHAMLEKIYVVESTFMLRNASGLFDFGRIHKLFMRKV